MRQRGLDILLGKIDGDGNTIKDAVQEQKDREYQQLSQDFEIEIDKQNIESEIINKVDSLRNNHTNISLTVITGLDVNLEGKEDTTVETFNDSISTSLTRTNISDIFFNYLVGKITVTKSGAAISNVKGKKDNLNNNFYKEKNKSEAPNNTCDENFLFDIDVIEQSQETKDLSGDFNVFEPDDFEINRMEREATFNAFFDALDRNVDEYFSQVSTTVSGQEKIEIKSAFNPPCGLSKSSKKKRKVLRNRQAYSKIKRTTTDAAGIAVSKRPIVPAVKKPIKKMIVSSGKELLLIFVSQFLLRLFTNYFMVVFK